jgi:transcriptional regulator with XRE-family HTH domain
MPRVTAHVHRARFDRNDHERRIRLGRLLRNARKDAGFTQEQVASVLGYTQSAVSRIEKAKRTYDPCELENFAHLYGKTLDDFATWREDQPTTEELRQRATSSRA